MRKSQAMEATLLSKVVLPLALFIVMFGMGLSLVPGDFTKIFKKSKPAFVGILGQLAILPLLAFVFTKAFAMDPVLAVGFFVIAVSPGGVTSNMFAYLAKGNTALSITLTAVVSLVTPFTVPVILNWKISQYLGTSSEVELPLLKTIGTLILITVLPVALGMLLRNRRESLAGTIEKSVKYLSMVFLFVIVAGIAAQNWAELPLFFAKVGTPIVLMNIAAMGVGFGLARMFRLSLADQKTIGVEVGIQNGTTALFITSTLLDDPIMSIPAAIYSLVMFGTGAMYSWYFSKVVNSKEVVNSGN